MFGKIISNKLFLFIMIVFLFSGCSSTITSSKTSGLTKSDVTLITKVLPSGEVGYALACDFRTSIDGTKLTKGSFQVQSVVGNNYKERTITKVYTNDEAVTSETGKAGRYVIIEMDPKDSNATTFTFNMSKFLNTRNELKYYVVQKEDIKTSSGKILKASDNKIGDSKEITPVVDDFKKLAYTNSSGNKLNYRFFEPKTEAGKKYPLVLFLHGSGERGSDNAMQLLGYEGALVWAYPENQAKNPCYVLAPQSSATNQLTFYWTEEPNYSTVLALLKEIMSKYPVDPKRIYVTGMSNGGIGTWYMMEKNPDLFAAAIPVCGAANIANLDSSKSTLYSPVNPELIEKIKGIPVWAHHGIDDPLVDYRNSKETIEAIKAAGGKDARYSEYPRGTGHSSWIPTYQDKELIQWLFKQSRD